MYSGMNLSSARETEGRRAGTELSFDERMQSYQVADAFGMRCITAIGIQRIRLAASFIAAALR
jgi:hypothetical protein